ncbi:MAG: hypothetical protein U9R38_04995 [Candidatus Margulisiibacteriota bacterium]|nr:hypothetical protein [Candidatus Margulisiibacteriota bacterium]
MVESVSILRELKTDTKKREVENRVVLVPSLVSELKIKCRDIDVFVERDAGKKIDFSNEDYKAAGARVVSHREALSKDLVLGVKETGPDDFKFLQDNIWISYQHFAQSKKRTGLALKTKATFIALETMESKINGHPFFPCLAPMSEAAAKVIARHADEYALIKKKIITSGLPETGMHGVKTVILGGGTVGKTAAEEFSERGCEVLLLEKYPERLKKLEKYFREHEIRFPKVKVIGISPENLRNSIKDSFFIVSAMYTSGKKPEKIVTLDLLKTMMDGGCIYPVDIDQGGGIEGVLETSIHEPFDLPVIPRTKAFFFAPPNLPSMGARTTSEALGLVILPYVTEIINKGLEKAAEDDPVIKSGINIKAGKIIHPGLAEVFPSLK